MSYDTNKARHLHAFIKANELLFKQDTHRAKKAVRVILLVKIVTVSTLQAMLQTMLVKCLEVQTLNQTDIHDSASYAGKRLLKDNRLLLLTYA